MGMFALMLTPREEEPQIVVPMIDVMVMMPGASPEEVENIVARPMEQKIWEIEDDIRACESRHDFGEEFIRLARAVYRTNDVRAKIKKRANEATGSELTEEKSYVDPDGGA